MPTSISGRTLFFGLLCDPIAQAKSPGLVNAALRELELDAVLLPLHVSAANLETVVLGLRAIESFRGAIISMPHKTAIATLLDALTPEAELLQTCNVIHRTPEGELTGAMLDGEGFVAGLKDHGHHVAGKRIYVAGAGGAASAIALALAKHGARGVTIANRTRAKGERLASHVNAACPLCETIAAGASPAGYDIVVNATSLGMNPGDVLPVNAGEIDARALVADIVVAVERTALLEAAQARGCRIHPGLPMIAAQVRPLIEFMMEGR